MFNKARFAQKLFYPSLFHLDMKLHNTNTQPPTQHIIHISTLCK